MKKLIAGFVVIILFLFISICVVVSFDESYVNNLEKEILKNTSLKNIIYVNKYDNNYIVIDKEQVYLFNSNYEEIYKVKESMLHENKNDYDLVYRDNTIMYMDNYKSKEGIIFKYYDLYTYELIDEIVVGGN